MKRRYICLLSFLVLCLFYGAKKPRFLIVDTFSKSDLGRIPTGWKPYKEEAKEIYKVRVENHNAYLEAKTKGRAIQLGKRLRLRATKNLFLKWRWRVHQLPEKADERYKNRNDSAAAVYVFFNKGFTKFRKHTIKYSWSSTELPKGIYLKGHYNSNMYTIILENRNSPLNKWIEERVNVVGDYLRIFKKDKVPEILGIAIMSDSDDTKSTAWADYDDFVIEDF